MGYSVVTFDQSHCSSSATSWATRRSAGVRDATPERAERRGRTPDAYSSPRAGIALENAILYTEIQRMLEGFVRASVEAIEQRDPTTSGHSRRVSDLTVGLARAVERAGAGPYRGVALFPRTCIPIGPAR